MRYGEDDWRRDAPFWALAALFHAALFSTNPGMRWGLAKTAAAKPIPVEFVSLPLSAIGQQVPGDGSANLPGLGLGEYQPEKRGPAAPAKAAPKKAKRAKAVKAAAARPVRRPDPAAARAAFERKLAARDRQARLAMARAELAAKAAADRADALEAAKQAALRKARAEAARRAARTAKAAELSRALAAMPAPDEELRDSVSGVVPSGKAEIATGEHAAALAASADAGGASGEEPAYAADSVRRTGKDAYSAAASGGGLGQGGGAGAASFSLDGPIGSRKLLRRVLPDSPDWVAQRSLDLTVAIRFQVLEGGSVRTGAVIAKTSGFPDLDRRALQAIRGWRFQAAKGAAPVWGSVKFRFTN